MVLRNEDGKSKGAKVVRGSRYEKSTLRQCQREMFTKLLLKETSLEVEVAS